MKNSHRFELVLNWSSDSNDLSSNQGRGYKNHTVEIQHKPVLHVSAAKAFKGDLNLYNPEDLLLSSIASCHMMSYLYCCAQEGVVIKSYSDKAEGILEVNMDGSGRFVQVVLNPVVIIENNEKLELARLLHFRANKLCFIANSCNFQVVHNVSILVS